MMHLPSVIIVSFYFNRRRALATSVVLGGSGVGKFVFPHLSRYLIDKYGWRGANCILAAVILHGAVCGCVFRPVIAHPPDLRRRPRPPRQTGTVIIQKVIAEKLRRRRDSSGSLDGTTITTDGRLLRQNSPAGEPSSGRPRTSSDPVSADIPLRTFPVCDQLPLEEHGSSDELRSTATVSPVPVEPRPVSLNSVSTETSLSLSADIGRSLRRETSAGRLSSPVSLQQTVLDEVCDSPRISERVSVTSFTEVVPQSSVWVMDCAETELSQCETVDSLTQQNTPPTMPRLLPARSDVFLQVHSVF